MILSMPMDLHWARGIYSRSYMSDLMGPLTALSHPWEPMEQERLLIHAFSVYLSKDVQKACCSFGCPVISSTKPTAKRRNFYRVSNQLQIHSRSHFVHAKGLCHWLVEPMPMLRSVLMEEPSKHPSSPDKCLICLAPKTFSMALY